jgi:hypothetical protein
MASLTSLASRRPTLIFSPYKYPVYGVNIVPGLPGMRILTSNTTNSSLGGPAVNAPCKANGPIIPGL